MDSGSAERGLVERARAGDAEAFRALVDLHRDRAVALALRIVGHREEAEEAAQDAFVRVWRALPEFRGESSFATWLHRIVVRLAIDRSSALRSRSRRETTVDELPEVPAGMVADAGASAGGESDPLLGRQVERLLGRLSEVQRAAVVLYHLEDRPLLEVADVLGQPENTVKTHLARARAAMRVAWEREASRVRPAIEETR
jgi:RNA polymerase sigma-70 factor (ECF subfamily)